MDITYYAGMSLDGFIAKPNGDVSWLDELGIPMEETGYEEFFSTVDCLAMGRKTYEVIECFGSWPYGDKPTWVCSTRGVSPMVSANLQSAQAPEAAVAAAKSLGLQHMWLVGGGVLASAFLELSLLTRVIVVQMPVVLGDGIPLFGPLATHVAMVQEKCHFAPQGFTQLDYRIRECIMNAST